MEEQKAHRAGSPCGGMEDGSDAAPPQAENPASQDSLKKAGQPEVYMKIFKCNTKLV